MKLDSTASQQMIRFSLDVDNSQNEIREAVAAVQSCVRTGSIRYFLTFFCCDFVSIICL